MEKVKDQILNVVNDNSALAQVFIVIFFFEDYFIIVQKTSLLHTTIDLKTISFQPFIFFFVFIALSKVLWFIWCLVLIQIKSWIDGKFELRSDNDSGVSKKMSLYSFMFCILLPVYISQISSNDTVAPVSAITHPFWHGVVFIILLITIFVCLMTGSQSVNYDDEKK